MSQNRALSILAKRVCHCAVKTCHPPRAHCHLQQEQQRQGTKKKIQTFYIDVSSILFTYNGNDLFPLRGRKADGVREKKRDGLSGRGEKKFKMP